MRTVRQVGAPALAFTTVFALAQLAQAQEPVPAPAAPAPAAPAPAPEPTPAPAPAAAAGGNAQMQMGGGAQAQGGGAMTLPGAAPAAQAAPGDSDHDAVVGSLGIGFLGRRSMLVGCANGGACAGIPGAPFGAGVQEVGAPVIGIRYWIDQTVGLDAGLGVAFGGSGLTINPAQPPATTGDVPQPSFYAFMIHGGLPLALASSGHYSFQIIPEVNVGFGGWSQDAPALPLPARQQGWSGTGFHLDVGARAGAEIHFGFIGLPKLALQGSVGLLFAMSNTSSKDKELAAAAGNPPPPSEVKVSSTSFATTVQAAPWEIFTTNVAALYYF